NHPASTGLGSTVVKHLLLPMRPQPRTVMASDRQPGQSPAPDHNTDNHKTDPDLAATNAVIEEAEILHASIKAGTVAQIVVAVIAVIGLLYLLKLVMVTTLVAILLAFVLEPLVGRLPRIV